MSARQLSDFAKGQRVRYIGHRVASGVELHGLAARVVRPVKSRGVVTLDWIDAPDPLCRGWFDAKPENLEPLEG